MFVDGQYAWWQMWHLITELGLDFRDIISMAFRYKTNSHIEKATIVYRDTEDKGASDETIIRRRQLFESLKRQGINVLGIPDGENGPNGSFNLDRWLEKDIRNAINSPSSPKLIVIVSGDGHFTWLAKMARKQGIEVVVIGNEPTISASLARNADLTFDFSSLEKAFTAE